MDSIDPLNGFDTSLFDWIELYIYIYIYGAKEKFLRGTSLLIPPKLDQKIDNITDKFYSYYDIDSIREKAVKSIGNFNFFSLKIKKLHFCLFLNR